MFGRNPDSDISTSENLSTTVQQVTHPDLSEEKKEDAPVDLVKLSLTEGDILDSKILLIAIADKSRDLSLLERSIIQFCKNDPERAGELLDIVIEDPDDVELAMLLVKHGAKLRDFILVEAIGLGRPFQLIQEMIQRGIPDGFYNIHGECVPLLLFAALHPDQKVYELIMRCDGDINVVMKTVKLLNKMYKSEEDYHFPRKIGISLDISWKICHAGVQRIFANPRIACEILLKETDKIKDDHELLNFYDRYITLPCFKEPLPQLGLFSEGAVYPYSYGKIKFIEFFQSAVCHMTITEINLKLDIILSGRAEEYLSRCKELLNTALFSEEHHNRGVNPLYRNKLLQRIAETERYLPEHSLLRRHSI